MSRLATTLHDRLRRAIERRDALRTQGVTDALRLVHGRADGLDGLVIEQLGPVLIVQWHEGRPLPKLDDLKNVLIDLMPTLRAHCVYLKHFIRDRAALSDDLRRQMRDPTPWIGRPAPDEFAVHEYGRRFLVRPFDGFSTGLFLEHRENRRRLTELAGGRRVLNLFAYTCAFSVAAAAGGAAVVDSVDLSKRYLEWGKRNFNANDLSLLPHRFFCSDTFDFLDRACRQGRRYDLVILDPPTFSRMRRPTRVFNLSESLPRLLTRSRELLEPGGYIFLAVNDRGLHRERLEESVKEPHGTNNCNLLTQLCLPHDFAGDSNYSKALLARFS